VISSTATAEGSNPLSLHQNSTLAPTDAIQDQRIDLVGQIGGSTKAVIVQGDYAYLGVGPRIVVLDITDPTNPTYAGQSPVLSGTISAIDVAGNYIYVIYSGNLHVLDISDPSQPVEVAAYNTPGRARGIRVDGNYAYVADGTVYENGESVSSGLHIIDISDPTQPAEVGNCATVGSAADVDVQGAYAYVGDTGIWNGSEMVGGGFRVIDVSDKSNPTRIANIDNMEPQAVDVSGDYAYTANSYDGMKIIDISTPQTPSLVGTYNPGGLDVYDIDIENTIAYIAGGWRGLFVVDVSAPANPVELSSLQLTGSSQGIFIVNTYAYIAAEYGTGLQIVDVSQPNIPTEQGAYKTKGDASDLDLKNNMTYIATGSSALHIVDVTQPTTPLDSGYTSFGDDRFMDDSITVLDNYAYIAYQGEGLQIIDVSNPNTPVLEAFYDSPGNAYGVAVAGNYAYLADGDQGLRIIDVSTPSNPVEAGYIDTPGSAIDVAVSGNLAYVADDNEGLRIVDISTPSSPNEISSLATDSPARAVSLMGDHAYIAEFGGLGIVDVSDPATPSQVSYLGISGYTTDVSLSGDYAFTASGQGGGVHMINISNPATPNDVASYYTPGSCKRIKARNNLLYVADGPGGLLILSFLDVNIATLNANTLRLSWSNDGDYDSYKVYRSTTPYFSPDDPATATITQSPWQYDDSTALGIINENYYYKVLGVRGSDASLLSNHIGEFDFNLVPGADAIQ